MSGLGTVLVVAGMAVAVLLPRVLLVAPLLILAGMACYVIGSPAP